MQPTCLQLRHISLCMLGAIIGESRQLVANELVEFFQYLVAVVQDCRKITSHFSGIYREDLNSIKKTWRG